MTEVEWERKMSRADAAKLLRKVADGLAKGEAVEVDADGFELKAGVADQVDVEIEVGLEKGETSFELELSWETGRSPGERARKPARSKSRRAASKSK